MDIREDLNIYMQIIRLLDESVNGYLYACDLQDDRMYFTDKICRRFALPFSGEQESRLKNGKLLFMTGM